MCPQVTAVMCSYNEITPPWLSNALYFGQNISFLLLKEEKKENTQHRELL